MSNNSFSLTKELALSSDIVLTCWCPTMDLCAVVSADGQLHLHRMDWQQLWALSPEALVTALCWRPDGKQLATGHANGAISVLDVETGDVVSDNKVHYAAITTLQWSDQASPAASTNGGKPPAGQQLLAPQHSMLPHQRFKRLFAPPELSPFPPNSTEPLPDPYDMCMEAAGAASWPAERAGLSLLCAGDARGHISLWLQGQVQIAEVAGGVHASEDEEGDSLAAAGPYQLVHAIADSGLQQLLTVNRSSSGAVVVMSHSLSLLHEHQQPLQQCAALFSHIQTFLQAAKASISSCKQDWSSVHSDFTKRFDTQLKQELSDQGSSITEPQQELVLLLATGSCSPPLHNFLSSTLGEAGLRRLARSTDAALNSMHTALLERLMPLAELVLFLLGELRGAVLAAGAESWMGLQVDSLQQLELQAAALLLRMEQLRRVVTSTACQYRAFCTWLLKTIQQLERTQDANGVLADNSTPLPQCQEIFAFLKGQFVHDIIGPEVSGAGLDAAAQARAEAKFYQGVPAAETHQLLAMLLPFCPTTKQQQQPGQHSSSPLAAAPVDPLLVREAAAACSRPVAEQLQHLASLAETVFELPVMHMSPCIAAVARLQLLPGAAAAASPFASPTQTISTPTGAAAAKELVAVAPPLLQPKAAVDLHTYVACLVHPEAAAPASAVAAGGRQQLLLARLQTGSGSSSGSDGRQLTAEAVVLQLPEGLSSAAWAFYKDQQLALLLHDPSTCKSPDVISPTRFGASTPSSSGSSSLHLVDLSEAPWAAVSAVQLPQPSPAAAGSADTALQQCVAAGAVVDMQGLQSRSRVLQQGLAGQLAVSRARGLGSLVTDMQHLLLLDLEEDEEASGEEVEGSDAGQDDMDHD